MSDNNRQVGSIIEGKETDTERERGGPPPRVSSSPFPSLAALYCP